MEKSSLLVLSGRTLGQHLDRVQLARKPKPTEKCLMTPANPLLPASPRAGHTAVPALGFGRGSTFRVWKPHNGACVLFRVCTRQGHGCSHHVAHERACTSRAGRELACLPQRRSPRRRSGEECVCLSQQNFPVSLEEEARPPARRERGSVCLQGREIPASRPLATAQAAFLSRQDLCSRGKAAALAISYQRGPT